MTAHAKPHNDSLEAHDIYFRNYNDLEICPAELRDLFELIAKVKDLKWDYFCGSRITNDDPLLDQLGPMLRHDKARHDYEKDLKDEATRLEVICSNSSRQDSNETQWVQALLPVVFYRFNQEQEETFARDRRHHCFICRKHYPANSRPLLNGKSAKAIELAVGKRSRDKDENLCHLSGKDHFNLPNFDSMEQLAYPEYANEGKKIPDLTIGLRSYNLTDRSEITGLQHNDRVRFFDQKLLRELEMGELLQHPFIQPGSSKPRVSDMSLTFPFGLWEAKREGGTADHQTARKQNAKKVKMILSWQEKVGATAEVPRVPLVWYFTSVGSKWEIHGCHLEKNSNADEGRTCVLGTIWSGDSANVDDALQLLYIIDIIALWGEHTYKPFAGACLQRLQAKLENKTVPPLGQTLLSIRLDVNNNNFPWLFPEQDNVLPSGGSPIAKRKKPRKLRSQTQLRSQSSQSTHLIQEIEQLSLNSSSPKDYIIPERDFYIWLLDRDPKGEDILIVRIAEDGSVLPPLLISHSASWDDRDFRRLLKGERARHPDDVLIDFRHARNGSSYLERCIVARPEYFRQPQTQFCAIIPLDFATYKRQYDRTLAEDAVFDRLESLLGLLDLTREVQAESEKWCECRGPYYIALSPNMILCDNLKCSMGWYHKKCVGLDEDFTADHWLCKECLKNWRGNEYGDFDFENISAEKVEASDIRVQRTKALARVWKAHQWPRAEKVRRVVGRISCRIEIEEETAYNTVRDVSMKQSSEARCWGILRSSPKVMKAVNPVRRIVASGTKKTTQRLKHRKSDAGVSRVAATSNLLQKQPSERLSLPQWNHI